MRLKAQGAGESPRREFPRREPALMRGVKRDEELKLHRSPGPSSFLGPLAKVVWGHAGGTIAASLRWIWHVEACVTKGLSALGWFAFPWCFRVHHGCGSVGFGPLSRSLSRFPPRQGILRCP